MIKAEKFAYQTILAKNKQITTTGP